MTFFRCILGEKSSILGGITLDETGQQRFEAAFKTKKSPKRLLHDLGVSEGEMALIVNGRKIEIVNGEVNSRKFLA